VRVERRYQCDSRTASGTALKASVPPVCSQNFSPMYQCTNVPTRRCTFPQYTYRCMFSPMLPMRVPMYVSPTGRAGCDRHTPWPDSLYSTGTLTGRCAPGPVHGALPLATRPWRVHQALHRPTAHARRLFRSRVQEYFGSASSKLQQSNPPWYFVPVLKGEPAQ
jgi:hypothetical protein